MYDILIAAGWPVWPLLITSILGLAILIERAWFLQAQRIAPTNLLDGAIQLASSGALISSNANQTTQALANAAPLGQILAAALIEKAHGASQEKIIEAMQEALPQFGKKIKGFDMADAVLTGIETRTSAPLQITRGADGQSLNTAGLYPAGEGAGYAGGILSAGVDGIKMAEALVQQLLAQPTKNSPAA